MPTESLLSRLQQYEPAAWLQFIEVWAPNLYNYVYHNVDTLQGVEEVVSATFATLLQQIHTFTDDITITAFLYAIVYRQIVDHGRRLHPNDATDVEYKRFDRNAIYDALLQLPEQSKQALLLYGYVGLRLDELAVVSGRSLKATESLRNRVLTQLERILARDLMTLSQTELLTLLRTHLPLHPLPVGFLEQVEQQILAALQRITPSI